MVDWDEVWYDLEKDAELIEASFAAQYGIRLRQETEMSWAEFSALLSGILPDTPLGFTVGIRSEKDFKRIKDFTKAEKSIYNDWRRFVAGKKADTNAMPHGRRADTGAMPHGRRADTDAMPHGRRADTQVRPYANGYGDCGDWAAEIRRLQRTLMESFGGIVK